MGTGRTDQHVSQERPPICGLFFLWRLRARVHELPARTRACSRPRPAPRSGSYLGLRRGLLSCNFVTGSNRRYALKRKAQACAGALDNAPVVIQAMRMVVDAVRAG